MFFHRAAVYEHIIPTCAAERADPQVGVNSAAPKLIATSLHIGLGRDLFNTHDLHVGLRQTVNY